MEVTARPLKRLIAARMDVSSVPRKRAPKRITLVAAIKTTAGTGNTPLPFETEPPRLAVLRRFVKVDWRYMGLSTALAMIDPLLIAIVIVITALQVSLR